MKKIATVGLLLSSAATFAAPVVGSGFSIGVHGGLGSNQVYSKQDWAAQGFSQQFTDSASHRTGIAGATLGYNWVQGMSMLSLSATYSNHFGDNTRIVETTDSTQPALNFAIDTDLDVEMEHRFDFDLSWKQFVSDSVNVFTTVGASVQKQDYDLRFHGLTTTPGTLSRSVFSEDETEWGGHLALGVEYFNTANTSFTTTLDYAVYSTAELKDVTNVSTANNLDQLLARKVAVNTPSIRIGYNYYFSERRPVYVK